MFRGRAARATPAALSAAYERASLHRPSSVDARLLDRADRAAYEAAPAFEALDLSPVEPFGACAALGGLDPNNVLGALRDRGEAPRSGRGRRAAPGPGVDPAEVRAVAAAHRIGAADEVLRARGVTLPSDVRDPRRDLGALHACLPAEVALRLDRLREHVVPDLAAAHPGVDVRVDLSRLEGLGYYPGLAFRVRLEGPAGWLPVGDGGFTPWTQALLADRKERFRSSRGVPPRPSGRAAGAPPCCAGSRRAAPPG